MNNCEAKHYTVFYCKSGVNHRECEFADFWAKNSWECKFFVPNLDPDEPMYTPGWCTNIDANEDVLKKENL